MGILLKDRYSQFLGGYLHGSAVRLRYAYTVSQFLGGYLRPRPLRSDIHRHNNSQFLGGYLRLNMNDLVINADSSQFLGGYLERLGKLVKDEVIRLSIPWRILDIFILCRIEIMDSTLNSLADTCGPTAFSYPFL